MIYFDNASTAPMNRQAFIAAARWMLGKFGNAGSIHSMGVESKSAIDNAREKVAGLINAKSDQIIFTSGGTESNNMVFAGVTDYLEKQGKKHIIVSSIEHDSVINAAKSCIKLSFGVSFLPVNGIGTISYADLSSILANENVGLLSVMYANNEIGCINNMEEIGKICKQHGVLFHTDCVQAAGMNPIDVEKFQCDFLSISGHKIGAGKGVGALYVRDKTIMTPMIKGGTNQEFGLRGGTENVPGIVALGVACEIANANQESNIKHIKLLKHTFYHSLKIKMKKLGISDGVVGVNGLGVSNYGKVLNLKFRGIDAETLVMMMSECGVCISSGSACRSHESEPSRVLLAIGLSPEEARSSVRISFSPENTVDEVAEAVGVLADCVKTLTSLC